MTNVFVPGLKALTSTKIVKVRELPIPGNVRVDIGSKVGATDTVLEAALPGNLHILRIAERLGIEPHEAVNGFTVRGLKVGDSIKTGDVLCEHSGLFGLFSSRFQSPCSGVVEYISESNGHVGVREPSSPLSVSAYISGAVSNINPGKSVTIEATGALVQGIFGVGGERIGRLNILKISADTELLEEHIPKDCRGEILVGGMAPSLAVINAAASAGAVGLICGSIDDKALTGYLGYDLGVAITGDEEIPMTLIVTEGFGRLPISSRVLDILGKFNGVNASINGATQVRAGAIRPEILVIHNNEIADSKSARSIGLEVGLRVRIIRVPYFGLYGEVVELPSEALVIETGAHARVLKAKLDDGSIVTIPRANVEIAS